MRDLVEMAANPNNVKFDEWKKKADADPAPLVASDLVDSLDTYCRTQTMFLVLSDEEKPFLETMP